MPGAGASARRHLILGTAGHVDHGKTELVRALTGRDTDRLKEEKERGISIELGFAPLPLDDDTFIGIVDVPGHERFVRQMVAGAGGLDMAMLLVAADEGVMPQTREHMEVLTSLHIDTGVVVVSKCDLASEDTMLLLREEVAELTRGTFLEDAPVVEASARTGEGIDTLRETLASLAREVPGRSGAGPFRLAVDRVFHQQGIGVVVTGSCYSGSAGAGDALELLPAGTRARIRELQSFGEKRDRGGAGERLALALQGVKLDDVQRGDMVVTPGAFAATDVVDARIRIAAYAEFEIGNRERIRVHHGAREVLGRVILLESDALRSGQSGLVQVRLESPIVPGAGDAFVVRKYSPMRVVGGGVVIDPSPEKHRRFDADAIERIRVREQGDPASVLAKTLERAGLAGEPASALDAAAVDTLCERGDAVRVAGRVFDAAAMEVLARAVEDRAAEYTARNPLQWGIDKEELRGRVGFPHGAQVFNSALEEVARRRPVFVRGNRVRAGGDELVIPKETARALDALAEAIRARGLGFGARAELEAEWSGSDRFADAVQVLKDAGTVVDLGEAGLLHSDAIARALDALRELFSTRDEISVGDVKDALGLTRKHAIPLLEFFDGERVTVRAGNARRRGPALRG